MAKKKKSKSRSGNVTELDFGEKVDQAFLGGLGDRYRPGHTGISSRHMGRGISSPWWLGQKFNIPRSLDSKQVVAGGLLGVVAQRTLNRITPKVLNTDKKLVVDAVNFGVGVLPFAVIAMGKSRTGLDLAAGIALPGLFQLGGTLADLLLDYTGLEKPALSGPSPKKKIAGGRDAAQALRGLATQAQTARQTLQRQPSFAGKVHSAV